MEVCELVGLVSLENKDFIRKIIVNCFDDCDLSEKKNRKRSSKINQMETVGQASQRALQSKLQIPAEPINLTSSLDDDSDHHESQIRTNDRNFYS